jgi:hypothetical protein
LISIDQESFSAALRVQGGKINKFPRLPKDTHGLDVFKFSRNGKYPTMGKQGYLLSVFELSRLTMLRR